MSNRFCTNVGVHGSWHWAVGLSTVLQRSFGKCSHVPGTAQATHKNDVGMQRPPSEDGRPTPISCTSPSSTLSQRLQHPASFAVGHGSASKPWPPRGQAHIITRACPSIMVLSFWARWKAKQCPNMVCGQINTGFCCAPSHVAIQITPPQLKQTRYGLRKHIYHTRLSNKISSTSNF